MFRCKTNFCTKYDCKACCNFCTRQDVCVFACRLYHGSCGKAIKDEKFVLKPKMIPGRKRRRYGKP